MATKKVITDPSPSKFNEQALLVALVLIALGILVFIFASVIAGGVIALLGAVFGLGSQVARAIPVE
jgi:hypothetical protein